jgi:hypothetical protein
MADEKTCPYCVGPDGVARVEDIEKACGAEHGLNVCSRETGHGGDHVACGIYFHDVVRWPNQA